MVQDISFQYQLRRAGTDDLPGILAVMRRSITRLQIGFLDEQQIQASHAVMGLDTQLIADGTYYVAQLGEELAGCGGWSRRATLFGGDQYAGRDPAWLDPKHDAARIRAMYTDPDHARRGIGRRLLVHCEAEARAAGFRRAELAATLSGEPLYRAAGYQVLARFTAGDSIPLLHMAKAL